MFSSWRVYIPWRPQPEPVLLLAEPGKAGDELDARDEHDHDPEDELVLRPVVALAKHDMFAGEGHVGASHVRVASKDHDRLVGVVPLGCVSIEMSVRSAAIYLPLRLHCSSDETENRCRRHGNKIAGLVWSCEAHMQP